MLEFSTQNKIATYVAIFHTKQNSDQPLLEFSRQTNFGSTYVGLFPTKKNSDQPLLDFFLKKKNSNQPILQLSWQDKIRTNLCCNFPHKTKFGLTYVAIVQTKKIRINLCWNFPHKTKFGSTCVGIFHTKQNCNLCWNFPQKTKFGSTSVGLFSTKKKFGSSYIAIVLKKQNSDQPILQFSTQNKIWINLCCNFPHKTKCGSTSIGFFYTKRKKLGSSYIAIVLSEQNSDQPMLQFSTQNKIRINLCWTFPHKKKFGSTYVAIFHPNKIRETCPRMWGPVSAETRKYISNHFRQPRQNSLL